MLCTSCVDKRDDQEPQLHLPRNSSVMLAITRGLDAITCTLRSLLRTVPSLDCLPSSFRWSRRVFTNGFILLVTSHDINLYGPFEPAWYLALYSSQPTASRLCRPISPFSLSTSLKCQRSHPSLLTPKLKPQRLYINKLAMRFKYGFLYIPEMQTVGA